MNLKYLISGLAVLLLLSSNVFAAGNHNSTPAIQGYDPVSYHTGKRPVRGNGHFLSEYEGATYMFSSKDNKKRFDKNPAKYAPAYGGFCAYGVSVGKKFIGDPEVWRIVDGKTYLNLDANVQDVWLKDVPGNIEAADDKWGGIANTPAADL